MPEYKVLVVEHLHYSIIVEADNKDKAEEIAILEVRRGDGVCLDGETFWSSHVDSVKPTPLKKSLDNVENREFWEACELAKKTVDSWPAWKRVKQED